MVHHDLSNQRRRSSFTRGGDDGTSGGLKAMMSNLLPSLDASMDSHFSKDFSHSEVTATTAAHTSTTSAYSFGASTTSSYSFGHDDLGDSSGEDASMSASTRIRRGSVKVKQTLKKAFNKMAKKSNSSGTSSTSNNKRTSSSGKKKDKDKKSTGKNKKGARLQLEETRNNKKNKGSKNDDGLDSVADPPTVCSAAIENQSEEEEEEEYDDDDEYDRDQPRRTRSRSRPSMRSSKNAQQRNKSRKSRSRSRSESESSESDRLQNQRASIRNASNCGGGKGGNSSSSNNNNNNRRDEPCTNNRKKRSSRRGGGGSGKSPTRTSTSGGNNNFKRMPPKAKSYDSSNRPPPLMTAMGDLIAMGGGASETPLRRSSTLPAGRDHRGEKNHQGRNSVRSSNVTAQAALPKPPRPSMSRRNSSMKHVSGSSSNRRRSADGGGGDSQGNNSNGKSIPRSRSLKHVDQYDASSSAAAAAAESHHSHNNNSKKTMRRSKSFKSDKHSNNNTDLVKPTKKGPGRAKSFDGATPPDYDTIRGGEQRRRSVSRTREAKRKSMPAASHQQRENGYSEQTKGSDPEPLFSLEDHFGGGEGSTAELKKLDEVSIDTCSTNGVQDKNNIKDRASNHSRRGRRSKSRSKSPGGSGRRSSTSRSPSRTRRGEGSEKEQPERARSVSRRPSSRSRSRPRRQPSPERERSGSRSRRQSSSERGEQGRSRSRSRQPVSRSSSIKPTKKERGRSKSAARQRRSISQQQAKRPSIQRRSSSRSRRESEAKITMKQYETLSKEDFMLPEDKRTAKGRRPRSLSRTKKSPKHRVSRSLSTTRKGKKEQHEGIGDYLLRQQPQRSPRDEDTNSQSTGSKTTESNEVTYATPSWMWNNSSSAASFNSAFFSAHNADGWTNFGGPMKEESSKTNSSGSDGQSLFQTSFTSNTNSYDAGSEMSTPTPSFPKTTTTGGNGFSPPLMTTNLNDSTSLNNSTSSLSASATPVTKAKHFYGKVLKKEQEEIRAQSQQLFQSAQCAGFATNAGAAEDAY